MITPREARLVRVATLAAFRAAAVTLACDGSPAAVRNRLVVVPTRAAAAHLLRTIEQLRIGPGAALVLPQFVTRGELVAVLADRLPPGQVRLTDAEREVLLGAAARSVIATGVIPPFPVRPALVAEMVRFYDELRWNRNTVAEFERRALDRLEAGADHDRGAERLVRQTRFLAGTFREYERIAGGIGADEHRLRERLIAEPVPVPYQSIVVTVADCAVDRYGLFPGDWDLLTRLPGLATLDVIVTDTVLAGPLHERLHAVLPGITEVRFEDEERPAPALLIPAATAAGGAQTPVGTLVHRTRDREEDVALFARRTKHQTRHHGAILDRTALVVQQPLPYVYVAREVLRSAGIPCQLFDTLPLAAEPYAAALDLVLSAVGSSFGRTAMIPLLRSPHFAFAADGRVSARADVAALDRALAEAGYLGERDALERLMEQWQASDPSRGLHARALPAAAVMLAVIRQLQPLRERAPVALQLRRLREFLIQHEHAPASDDVFRERQIRARGAIFAILLTLEQAYARFDDADVEFEQVTALVRRWIEAHTFQPLTGDGGVHVVDAASARYGDFDEVHLAGVIDGEWPEPPRRNIFYTPSVLRDLGWPSDRDRLDGARSAFVDLLHLPRERLVVSTFSLEADALVSPSLLLDELARAGLPVVEATTPARRIFEHEALVFGTRDQPPRDPVRPGWAPVEGPVPALSLSSLERYQDCPFKFFAQDVLRLEEAPDDESTLSPRARGRFIHEVFQRFFQAWDASGMGTITTERLRTAREMFCRTAEPLLARLPDAEAALERARLFGSAIAVGLVDVVLGMEVSRPVEVRERLLEYRLEGTFALGTTDRQVALKGVADRIDLLEGRRLRVIDYKSGYGPKPSRALQVPIYALCAQERLSERDGAPWSVAEAAYVAFSGKRTLVPVVRSGDAATESLADARSRLFSVIDGIAAGLFPPRPHDPMMCRYCAYPAVCRKDYVGDE